MESLIIDHSDYALEIRAHLLTGQLPYAGPPLSTPPRSLQLSSNTMDSMAGIFKHSTVSLGGPHAAKPLDKSKSHIRLIEILQHRGDTEDSLVDCKFRVYRVNKCPDFVALS